MELIIKSSIFDRNRRLIIDSDFIEFDNNDLASDLPTRLLRENITDIRHGIKWINGYQFVIGRIYCIDVQSVSREILKIRLKSLYGIGRKRLYEKYGIIINALYDNFFDDISRQYLTRFFENQKFQIAGIYFTQTGISLDSKSEIIPWDDVGTKNYSSYYAIFSKSNPIKYKALEYLDDWNTGVLYSVSRQILIDKGLHIE